MVLDAVLECENHFQAGPRSEIVHEPPCCRSKVDEKDIKELLKSSCYELRSSDGNYACSPHRKSMPARPHSANSRHNDIVRKDFKSSRERKSMRKLKEETKKEEQAFSEEAFLSFEIVEPLPQINNKESESMEFVEMSFRDLSEDRVKLSNSCSGSFPTLDILEDCIIEFGMHSNNKSGKRLIEEQKSCRERDTTCNLPKSFSVKAVMFNSSETENFKGSPKPRFSPFKRIFDPIMKSKSMKNPSYNETETGGSIKKHKVFRKSLLNDFSKTLDKIEYDPASTVKGQVSTSISSPVHLHAVLKSDCLNGSPSYEFAIKDRDDIFLAKTWRTDSAFNWVYTFHKKKSRSKERSAPSHPMLAQMQVSCYLCSEVNDTGSLESSTVTEFVLYDIAQARRSFSIDLEKSSDFDSDPSSSYPWATGDLHPYLEIAAIVTQIPFNKKEMKEMMQIDEEDGNGEDRTFDCMYRANVKAVTPSGPHGLPTDEEGGPSSLLDRWRIGGGCDCGGWDMACPIAVLDKLTDNNVADPLAKGSRQQMLLYVQGSKEKIPAVSITSEGKGQYSIYFHARLSALQAFSICISILHSSQAASALGPDSTVQNLYSNSLKLILEEEVRKLLEAVAEEEKRKAKKKVENPPSSFILESPFSPMGRV